MRWIAAILLSVLLSASAKATTIEARLISASNDGEKTDEQLVKLEPKLKKVFGFQHYKQLGLQGAPLKDRETVRLDLGEGIVIFLTPTAVEKKSHVMDFEMYSGRAALIKTTIHIPRDREMFIKGPSVGNGLLVVAFVVVE